MSLDLLNSIAFFILCASPILLFFIFLSFRGGYKRGVSHGRLLGSLSEQLRISKLLEVEGKKKFSSADFKSSNFILDLREAVLDEKYTVPQAFVKFGDKLH